MIEKLEGIVLGERDYGETSKILNVLTQKYGVIGIMSKGCKNIKSDLRVVSTKLTYGYFYVYYKEDKLSTLTNVDIINSFKNIKSDIVKISYATFLTDLTAQVIKQNSDAEIYNIFIASLIKLENNFDAMVITNIAELKYLSYLGVMPILDGCSICGSTSNIVSLSCDKGGYVCQNCLQHERLTSVKTIKMIRMFYYVDISKIEKLDISNEVKNEINKFLDDYYDKYTGLYLKTKTFLNNLNKIC
ncbi:MAG: DNA repair protein RecO [Bacilli bacterium]|nr:DNA repair protein RecO [Bacilli bacterium]